MQRIKKYIGAISPRTRLWIAYFLAMGIGYTVFTRLANSINAIFFLPAELIMAAFALGREKLRRDVPLLFGAAAILWGLLAAVMNGGILTEAGAIAHWGMAAAWLFALRLPREGRIHEEFTAIALVMLVCYLPFALVALFSVFSGIAVEVPAYSYPLGIEGMGRITDRIRVMANPNVCGRTAALSVLFSIYIFGRKKKALWRIFAALCLVVNLLVVAHAQSRGCIIGLGAGLAVVAFRMVYARVPRRALGAMLGILACGAMFALNLFGMDLIYDGDIAIAKRTAVTIDEEAITQGSYAETEGQFDVSSSGRTLIWTRTVEYLLEHPKDLLFGMNTSNPMSKIAPEDEFLSRELHVHNVFLDCVVNLGLGYLLIVLGFLVYMVPRCLRVLTSPGSGGTIFVAMIVALLTTGLVEVMLFSRYKMENTLFMCLCGYVIRLGGKQRPCPDAV